MFATDQWQSDEHVLAPLAFLGTLA